MRSLSVHREHAVIGVICEGYISKCNEDARQGMSAKKSHVKTARITSIIYFTISELNAVPLRYEKHFFFHKKFFVF